LSIDIRSVNATPAASYFSRALSLGAAARSRSIRLAKPLAQVGGALNPEVRVLSRRQVAGLGRAQVGQLHVERTDLPIDLDRDVVIVCEGLVEPEVLNEGTER
jgi:hypothetical protein